MKTDETPTKLYVSNKKKPGKLSNSKQFPLKKTTYLDIPVPPLEPYKKEYKDTPSPPLVPKNQKDMSEAENKAWVIEQMAKSIKTKVDNDMLQKIVPLTTGKGGLAAQHALPIDPKTGKKVEPMLGALGLVDEAKKEEWKSAFLDNLAPGEEHLKHPTVNYKEAADFMRSVVSPVETPEPADIGLLRIGVTAAMVCMKSMKNMSWVVSQFTQPDCLTDIVKSVIAGEGKEGVGVALHKHGASSCYASPHRAATLPPKELDAFNEISEAIEMAIVIYQQTEVDLAGSKPTPYHRLKANQHYKDTLYENNLAGPGYVLATVNPLGYFSLCGDDPEYGDVHTEDDTVLILEPPTSADEQEWYTSDLSRAMVFDTREEAELISDDRDVVLKVQTAAQIRVVN